MGSFTYTVVHSLTAEWDQTQLLQTFPGATVSAMTTSELRQDFSFSDVGFKVVIACENSITGVRALELYQRLSHRLADNFPLNHTVWRFPALEVPKVRQAASTEAGIADMIVLSIEGESPLPHHVRAWLESCLSSNPEQSRALVVLLGTSAERPETAVTCEYLRTLTASQQTDLFIHGPDEMDGKATSSWTTTSTSSLSTNRGRWQQPEALRSVQPRWGINE